MQKIFAKLAELKKNLEKNLTKPQIELKSK